MNASTPARDFLLPGLTSLIAEARGHGISRDVAVAVIIDLITGPGFNDTPLDPTQDAPAHDTGSFPIDTQEAARAYAEAIPNETAGGARTGIGHNTSRLTLP